MLKPEDKINTASVQIAILTISQVKGGKHNQNSWCLTVYTNVEEKPVTETAFEELTREE